MKVWQIAAYEVNYVTAWVLDDTQGQRYPLSEEQPSHKQQEGDLVEHTCLG
jgi:hypothetical protein